MLDLPIEDQSAFIRYIDHVRRCAIFCKLDDNEIVQEIEEHIKQEISNYSKPITREDIEGIIKNLGEPRKWIDENELSWWRKMCWMLWRGPDDWRLAYLSILLLFFGTALAGPFGTIASFFFSRVVLELEGAKEIHRKRWLIYPSLIIVYFGICTILLMATIYPLGYCIKYFLDGLFPHANYSPFLNILSAFFLVVGFFWFILDSLTYKYPSMVRKIFKPFADSWNPQKRPLWGGLSLLLGIVSIIATIVF